MPTNLPQEAKGKWNKVISAKTPEEKLEALKEFLSAIPKHKGNEKLRMQVKHKISDLMSQLERKKRRRQAGKKKLPEKSGAAQVVVLGLARVGKTSLMEKLTNMRLKIGGHSAVSTMGMMPYEDIQIQLIELSHHIFSDNFREGLDTLRQADGLLIVLDSAQDIKQQLKLILDKLNEIGITIVKPSPNIEVKIENNLNNGPVIQLAGRLLNCTIQEVKEFFLQNGLKNVRIFLKGEVSFEEIVEFASRWDKSYKPTLILVNKPRPDGIVSSSIIERFAPNVPLMEISSRMNIGLENVSAAIFKQLSIIRVYTREPGEKAPIGPPFTLKKGSRISDLAKSIHSEVLRKFRYAKIWGPSSKYPGEKVGVNHELFDKDLVEIYT
ncbi:MAG: TGS domain-containing protein [Candidatus Bathyarchaeia archaeon]